MDTTVKKPSQLSAVEAGAWRAFQAADPALASPYFALEYARACDQARTDTRVALVREKGQIKGFLPFQCGPMGYSLPLGGPLGDFQGLIGEPGAQIDLGVVMRSARMSIYPFSFVPASQTAFAADFTTSEDCHTVDLSGGFAPWYENRMAAHKKSLKRYESKARQMQRAHGDVRFCMDDNDPAAFAALLAWKSAQYRASGYFDVFSVRWTRELLRALWAEKNDNFCGQLSTLYVADRLVAAHFGMRTAQAAHYWFPAYDPDFARYGPGHTLLLEMIRAHAGAGVQALHLGVGDFRYKLQFGGTRVPLCSGTATTPSLVAFCRRAAQGLAHSFEALPLGPVSTLPGRALRRLDRTMAFRMA